MSATTGAPLPVFLAEDNPADVYLIRQALREHGVVCDLHVASNGREALTYLGFAGGVRKVLPVLIVLDLNLPLHDGSEILEFIRADPEMARVRVIVLTSSDSPRDRQTAMQGGADRYIKKPSTLDTFLEIGAVIREMLGEVGSAAGSGVQK